MARPIELPWYKEAARRLNKWAREWWPLVLVIAFTLSVSVEFKPKPMTRDDLLYMAIIQGLCANPEITRAHTPAHEIRGKADDIFMQDTGMNYAPIWGDWVTPRVSQSNGYGKIDVNIEDGQY